MILAVAAVSHDIRTMLMEAVKAAQHGTPPGQSVTQAINMGDRKFSLDQLEFDSLAWMEFCISIELLSGQELTPAQISDMRYLYELEQWLRDRV